MKPALLGIALFAACSGPPLDRDGEPVTIGKYRIRTFPSGAEVHVDGTLRIPRTPGSLILEAGRYHLEIRHPGATEGLEQDITVVAGRDRLLDVRIPKPARSTIAVDADVPGASVRINGYHRGFTPMEPVTVNAGSADVTVVAPGGDARSTSLQLRYGEQKTVDVRFLEADRPVEAGPATLTLVLAPAGWVETATGARIGDAPLRRHRMPAGAHDLVLRSADGQRTRSVRVHLRPGEHHVYRFRLKPGESEP